MQNHKHSGTRGKNMGSSLGLIPLEQWKSVPNSMRINKANVESKRCPVVNNSEDYHSSQDLSSGDNEFLGNPLVLEIFQTGNADWSLDG